MKITVIEQQLKKKENGQKDISKYFTEEDIHMEYTHIERCSISLIGKYKLKPQ